MALTGLSQSATHSLSLSLCANHIDTIVLVVIVAVENVFFCSQLCREVWQEARIVIERIASIGERRPSKLVSLSL